MKNKLKLLLLAGGLLFLSSCGTNNFCNNDVAYDNAAREYVAEKVEADFALGDAEGVSYQVLDIEYVDVWVAANPGLTFGDPANWDKFWADYSATNYYKNAVKERKSEVAGGACITLDDVKDENGDVIVSRKDWIYAIKQGPIELFIVFPVSNLLILLTTGFGGITSASSSHIAIASIAAIVIVTFLIRSLLLLVTFKSTMQTQRLQELQPEIIKIQKKYEGVSGADVKARQSQEIMRLYQKHNLRPFASMLMPFMTIPIFFAMWAAVGETWILKQGELWGVKMGQQMQHYLFKDFSYFALAIYLVSIIGQFFLIKIPQWRQQKKLRASRQVIEDKVLQQQKQTQTMAYVMIIMMVVIGITIPVGVSFYLITSNLFSIGQQFAVEYYIQKKKRSDKNANLQR